MSIDIINPNGTAERINIGRNVFDDLEIENFIDEVDFNLDSTKKNTYNILNEIGLEQGSIEYRQAIFNDLLDENLRSSLEKFVFDTAPFLFLPSCRGIRYIKLSDYLKTLEEYCKAIRNPPSLKNVRSEGLKKSREFIEEISKGKSFVDLFNFKDSFSQEGRTTLEFKVLEDDTSQISLIGGDETKGKPRPINLGLLETGNIYSSENQIISLLKRYLDNIVKESQSLDDEKDFIEQLDFYISFSNYFSGIRKKGFDVCIPKITHKKERKTRIDGAINPLLVEEVKKIVPNDIYHDPKKNLYVITGPNNGGKTTYVKTVGLLQILAQNGLPIPAKSAEISIVDGVYTHFVTPDDISKGEGRYKNELRRIKGILETATPHSLVILDEPCGGTSVEEGISQSLLLINGFNKLSCATYFTTHIHDIAKEVESGGYSAAENLHVGCIPPENGNGIRYTHKIEKGAAGKSYGVEIARELGLGPESIEQIIVKNAKKRGYVDLLRKN